MTSVRHVCQVPTKHERIGPFVEKLTDIKFYKHPFSGPTVTYTHTKRRDGRKDTAIMICANANARNKNNSH